MMPWSAAITIPTLVISCLSSAATAGVILLWLFSDKKKRSFRHSLVLNLTFAEFINQTNNSISGAYVLATRRDFPDGPACLANGWIGQVSVQAADFSILAIAIVTLLTFGLHAEIAEMSLRSKVLACLCVWLVPIITGTVALALGFIGPVPGNWCWIADLPRPDMRYILGHGWRFGIFLVTMCIYSFMLARAASHVRKRRRLNRRNTQTLDLQAELEMASSPPPPRRTAGRGADTRVGMAAQGPRAQYMQQPLRQHNRPPPPNYDGTYKPLAREQTFEVEQDFEFRHYPSIASTKYAASPTATGFGSQRHMSASSRVSDGGACVTPGAFDHEMRQWILLSVYPLTYMLVWIPGIANRLVELTGGESYWLTVLQATTQATGLFNAVAYCFREYHHSSDWWPFHGTTW